MMIEARHKFPVFGLSHPFVSSEDETPVKREHT